MTQKENIIVLKDVKMLYPKLFIPSSFNNSNYSYSATFLIPKSNEKFPEDVMQASLNILQAENKKRIAAGKKKKVMKECRQLIRDGDERFEMKKDTESEPYYECYQGHYYINLKNRFSGIGNSLNIPNVYDKDKNQLDYYIRKEEGLEDSQILYNLNQRFSRPDSLPHADKIFNMCRANVVFKIWMYDYNANCGFSGSMVAVRSLETREIDSSNTMSSDSVFKDLI